VDKAQKDKITCKLRFLLLKHNHEIPVLQQKKKEKRREMRGFSQKAFLY